MKDEKPTEVYYDGSCALCRASRRWAESRDVRGRLVFHDLTQAGPVAGLKLDRDGSAREMLARLPGGELAGGYDGWVAVLHALPRWRGVAPLLALPPIRLVGRAVYRLVARHRHIVSGRKPRPC